MSDFSPALLSGGQEWGKWVVEFIQVGTFRKGSRKSSGIFRRRIIVKSEMDEETSKETLKGKEKLVWPVD